MPVNATDYRMKMRPTEAVALPQGHRRTQLSARSNNRVNALGLTEPVIQQRGRAEAEGEIMVQLPGVDDPARVKQIIQTAAMLEIAEVKDGCSPARKRARAKHGGVLPLNTQWCWDGAAWRIRRELVSC